MMPRDSVQAWWPKHGKAKLPDAADTGLIEHEVRLGGVDAEERLVSHILN